MEGVLQFAESFNHWLEKVNLCNLEKSSDICQYSGSDEEIREAQKRIFEIAAGMELVKA